jgi:hypothetical protein
MTDLDDLLGADEPHASFHDASLVELHIDYAARTLRALFDLPVGDFDATDEAARDRRRRGTLKLDGLIFWVQEPPDLPLATVDDPCPWLVSNGPLRDWPNETARSLARRLPADAWAWSLYFSDWNASAHAAARSATFQWEP